MRELVREVSPSFGEGPGPNCTAHRKEFKDSDKDVARERTDSVFGILALQNQKKKLDQQDKTD